MLDGVVEASKYRYPAPLRLTEASEDSQENIEILHQPQRIGTGMSDASSHFELGRAESFMTMYRERGL